MCLIPTDLDVDMTRWLPAKVAKSAEEKHKHDEAVADKIKEKAEALKKKEAELMNMMSDDYEAPGYW